MQVDWAVIGRGGDRLSVFVATLGWSRSSYVEFCDDEKVETLILAHEHAFAAFGGIPREVLYDNVKTVVLERNRMAAGIIASTRASSITPITLGLSHACAVPIGRRLRARSSASSGI
jgi:transposase